ncbi:MAG: PEP-CTERM sorting domain-containing protein, partial [Planctomycetota bacterium]|nr:PEP-CTERM sorting domain-containing protein [Planctomycetota bacterium]
TEGNINALDIGTPADPGITGTLYQDWSVGTRTISSHYDSFGSAVPCPEVDTHFLLSYEDMTIPAGRELEEDNATPPTGFGTHLGGTFGLAPAVQAMTLDFVQLYLPTGTVASYAFEVSEAGQVKAVFEGTTPPVPEPSMMILLGLGSMAMLLIRRR